VWRDEGERGLRPEYRRSSVVDGGVARRSPPGGAAARWTRGARSGAGARGRVHDEQPTETATAMTILAKSRSSSSSTSTGRARRGGSEVGARSSRRGGFLSELHHRICAAGSGEGGGLRINVVWFCFVAKWAGPPFLALALAALWFQKHAWRE